MGIKGRGRSGTSRDSNPACQCCSSAHLVQCEPDEASSFTNPNVGPGTYASLRLKLDAWSSAVQRGQKCSSPTRRLPSRSWGPIRPRVCSWFRCPQVFLSITNYLFKIYLTHRWVYVDLGVITMKEYSTLFRTPKLETYHQMQFSVVPRKHFFFGRWGARVKGMRSVNFKTRWQDCGRVSWTHIHRYWISPVSNELLMKIANMI